MTGQLQFCDAMTHKCIVLDLANQAGSDGRTRLLGVLYDELCRCACTSFGLFIHVTWCRRAWEDISGKIGASFKVCEYAVKQSDEVLRKAKSLHDILVAKSKRRADSSWTSSANKKAHL